MIRIDFLVKPNGDILGFNIKGHANFGIHGQDIVCAAVSSPVYMVANTVTEVLKVPAEFNIKEESGEFNFIIKESGVSACRDLFSGLKMHLLALEEQYSKNIRVNYREV